MDQGVYFKRGIGKGLSIRSKVMLILTTIALVPISLLSWFGYQHINSTLKINSSYELNAVSAVGQQLATGWFAANVKQLELLRNQLNSTASETQQHHVMTSFAEDSNFVSQLALYDVSAAPFTAVAGTMPSITVARVKQFYSTLTSTPEPVFRSYISGGEQRHVIALPLLNAQQQVHAMLLAKVSLQGLLTHLNTGQSADNGIDFELLSPVAVTQTPQENNQLSTGVKSDLNFLAQPGWQLRVSKPTTQVMVASEQYQQLMLLISAAILLLVLCLSWWFAHSLSRPLIRLTQAMNKITQGQRIPVPIFNDSVEHNQLSVDLHKLVVAKEQQQNMLETQRATLQITLRQLAEQKSALDEHAIVAVTDLQGTITYANKKFCEISGYAEDELIGENHRILNSGTHSKQFFKTLYKTLKQGHVWNGQICNKAKHGGFYWVDTTIAPFLDENGKPQSYIAIRTDITTLKLQEIELEQHKTQLQLVMDSTAVGIWDWYINTNKLVLNNRWAEIIGYTLSELEPTTIKCWEQFLHPDDLISSESKLTAHLAGKTDYYVNEARMKHKQGHWVWVLDTAKVVEWNADGSPMRVVGTHLDISEQKSIQSELQSSRDQFATLVENIPGIIYRCQCDQQWTMLYMSKQVKELTGYEADALLQNNQLSFVDIIHPDDRAAVADTIHRCIEQCVPWSIEYRIITRNNAIVWVNEKGQAIYDATQNISYLDGFILDITERYQAQLKIARQQSLLESMSKQGQIGAWEIDVPAQTLYWSDEVRVIHEVPEGYTPDIDTAVNYYKPGYHRETITTLFEKALSQGEGWNVELIIITHTGKERWVRSIAQAEFENGQCVRVVGSFQSIDTHKRLEIESEKTNRYNKNLAMLTIAPQVQSSDVAEVKKLAVQSMCEVLGVQRASVWIFNEQCDVLQCHSLFIKDQGVQALDVTINANDYPAYFNAIYEQNLIAINDVATHPATVELIERYTKPNNITSKLDAVITTGDGNLGILCAETVGELRHWTQSEETYLRSLATLVGSTLLSQRRKAMSEELKDALTQAKAAALAKTQFLATMSHEIRTPMNGVLGMLELIQLETLPKHIETKVSIAKTSAHSLLGVINDVLDFSKAEAGKIELESINFNARDLIGEVAAAQAFMAQNKGIEIILDLVALEPSQLSGDPGRIRQVLTNLVSNAVKFTHTGEVVISAAIKRDNEKLALEITVKDTGIGITAEKQQQLFSPFMQVDASTTREYGGSGLGLAICKQLCALMGGSISLHSEPGKGSEFSVTLHVSEGEQQTRHIPSVNMKQLTILVVDDNETNRLVISQQLGHWGAKVELACDAEHALALCKAKLATQQPLYDIAVLDMQMPGMDGIELCKLLKADDNYKHIPLVMMTSIAGMEGAQRYSDAGFQAYFPKPVTTGDLISALSVITSSDKKETLPLVTSGYISSLRKAKKSEPASVLLVEDNPINQQVSTLMLKKLSCEITLAEHGQRALEILRSAAENEFKLVLMDCQMPVMDGYDATKAIRNGEAGDENKSIKIIALTANAMESDKERCLACGMDDYLSKPLQLNMLKDKLEQYF